MNTPYRLKPTSTTLALFALFAFCGLALPLTAAAQVAGSTPTSVTVLETSQLALGWSAKKSILGKTVYNDSGQKVGRVEDLIVNPDRNVSYVIVGAGGFIGIGRHDVAVPISQIRQQDGRFLMADAEARLSEMKQAGAARWHEFEAAVKDATSKLRRSVAAALA